MAPTTSNLIDTLTAALGLERGTVARCARALREVGIFLLKRDLIDSRIGMRNALTGRK